MAQNATTEPIQETWLEGHCARLERMISEVSSIKARLLGMRTRLLGTAQTTAEDCSSDDAVGSKDRACLAMSCIEEVHAHIATILEELETHV